MYQRSAVGAAFSLGPSILLFSLLAVSSQLLINVG